MHPISSLPGRVGPFSASRKDGSIWRDAKSIEGSRSIIKQAQKASIKEVFDTYDIRLSKADKKIICPFSFHNEHSASFYWYPETNSFYCFGCKNGGGPVEFVALYEGITKERAASQIVNGFALTIQTDSGDKEDDNFLRQQSLHMKFSDLIRNFLRANSNSNAALLFAEKITLIFDTVNDKNNLTNDGLEVLIGKLEKNLGKFEQWQEKHQQ